MIKWDGLPRKSKLPNDINYIEDETEHYEQIDNDVNLEDDEGYEVVEMEILPSKIICPDCGGITLEGLEFCDKCGGEL